jgi:hypothetical protein
MRCPLGVLKTPTKKVWTKKKKSFIQWNSALCEVLNGANRWQLFEGTQNKSSEENNWKKQQLCQIFDNYKIAES